MKLYDLNLDRDYCPDWTPAMALRELVANAIDTGQPWAISIDQETRSICITSEGSIPLQAIRIGHSVKDSNAIGRFGEGLKVAALVLLRNNISLMIEQRSSRWHFMFRSADELGISLHMGNEVTDPHGDETVATWINFEDEDFMNDCYMELQGYLINEDEVENNLLFSSDTVRMFTPDSGQGAIYVGGLLIKHCHDLKYAYDFQPSAIELNRDRSHVDMWAVSTKLTESVERNILNVDSSFLDLIYLLLEADQYKDFWALTESSWYPQLQTAIMLRVHEKADGKILSDAARQGGADTYVLSSSLSAAYRGGHWGTSNITRFEKKKQPEWYTDIVSFIEANKSKIRRDVRQQLEAILKKHETK